MNVKGLVDDYIKFRNEYYQEAQGRPELPVGASDEFISNLYLALILKEESVYECCGKEEESAGNGKRVHEKNGKKV